MYTWAPVAEINVIQANNPYSSASCGVSVSTGEFWDGIFLSCGISFLFPQVYSGLRELMM